LSYKRRIIKMLKITKIAELAGKMEPVEKSTEKAIEKASEDYRNALRLGEKLRRKSKKKIR